MYIDGHERDDVVTYRQGTFIPTLLRYKERANVHLYDPAAGSWAAREAKLGPGDSRVVFVNQDETLCYSADGLKGMWEEIGKPQIRPKSKGDSIHVSAFIDSEGNLLSVKTIEPKDDGMWSLPQLEQQTREMLAEFERLHPDCIAVVLLDNSTIHAKRVRAKADARALSNAAAQPDDALSVTDMALKPGGQQSTVMRDTEFNGKPQSMTFREGDTVLYDFSLTIGDQSLSFASGQVVSNVDAATCKLVGVAKGMRQVLMERGRWLNHLKRDCKAGIRRHSAKADGTEACCAIGALLACDDFSGARTVCHLKEIIEDPARRPNKQHHVCLFLPKVRAARPRAPALGDFAMTSLTVPLRARTNRASVVKGQALHSRATVWQYRHVAPAC